MSASLIWRTFDVVLPRIASFVLISYIVFHYGPGSFSIPAWTMSSYGLVASLVPDPSSYVLLLSKSKSITRYWNRLSLGLIVKTLLVIVFSIVAALIFAPKLDNSLRTISVVAGLMYALTDTLWSSCSLYRLASDDMFSWAVIGSVARSLTLAFLFLLDLSYRLDANSLLIIYSVPLLAICMYEIRNTIFSRVSLMYSLASIKHYAAWSYLNGFILSFVLQSPLTLSGANASASSAQIGSIAYAYRIIAILNQPLQIFQSALIRDYNAGFNLSSQRVLSAKLISRLTGVAMLMAGYLMYAYLPDSTTALLAIIPGVALFAFFRFEFALLNAAKSIYTVSLKCVLPALITLALFYIFNYPSLGLTKVAIGVSIFYSVFASLVVSLFRKSFTSSHQVR